MRSALCKFGAIVAILLLAGCLHQRCDPDGTCLPLRDVHRWLAIHKQIDGPLFGEGGPSPYDVVQGDVGTCWLLSAAAATAGQQPAIIERMFRAKEAGVYEVTFMAGSVGRNGDAASNAASVKVSIVAGVPYRWFANEPLYARSKHGIWVSLLEKAYAKAFASDEGYEGIGGDHPHTALHRLTGWRIEDYDVDGDLSAPGEDSEWEHLLAAYRRRSPMVAGSRIAQLRPDIVPMHAYAITGMDRDERGDRFVRIFDPEALNDQPNSELTLTLDEFNDAFFYVSIADPP